MPQLFIPSVFHLFLSFALSSLFSPWLTCSLSTDLFKLCPYPVSFLKAEGLRTALGGISVSGTSRGLGWKLWASISLVQARDMGAGTGKMLPCH